MIAGIGRHGIVGDCSGIGCHAISAIHMPWNIFRKNVCLHVFARREDHFHEKIKGEAPAVVHFLHGKLMPENARLVTHLPFDLGNLVLELFDVFVLLLEVLFDFKWSRVDGIAVERFRLVIVVR
jgi:hypothetical protein